MADRLDAFLAGERTDDVAFYLHEDGVGDVEALADVGVRTDHGVLLVLPGEEGRAAFQRATSLNPMNFAGMAMDTEGEVDRDLTDGTCPAGDGEDHYAKFVFAFAEEHHPEMEGLYAEGDVLHAYAACACGETYSEKWLAGEDGA
ncbi:DUF5807 family protein [Salinirubellus salinus]|uniref:DUF5807 family protein n=1 Tax=Salinirubellus salinus TaxID=1364945 RepID=A0A9E7U9Z2_9EURY|nr:DUF5807 family protein [Salinirubellus salinus]UWM53673.1 DUF5807 family protein [Salinirubellus salinus]